MAFLDKGNFHSETGTGVHNLRAASARSHHAVTVTCATSISVTIRARIAGHDGLIEFDDNVLQSGKSATLILPGAHSLQITPSDNDATYTASVQSF